MSERIKVHELSLRRGHEAGIEAYGDLGLTFEAYAAEALRAVERRLDQLSLDADRKRVGDALARMAGADLYLARACELGSVDAWAALANDLVPRLTGLARKRGARGSSAEEEVSALLSDLALPPPRGRARTLIGTYGGAGSLFGWLSVILVRRFAGEARRKKPDSLDQRPDDEQDVAPAGRSAPEDPSQAAQDDESRRRIREAIRRGFAACTPKEQLALVLKFRDGLPQRRMAALLEVGEPRVSRLVKQALTKLGTAARAHLPEGLDPSAYAAAADSVGETLASLDAPARPSPAGTSSTPGDEAADRPGGQDP